MTSKHSAIKQHETTAPIACSRCDGRDAFCGQCGGIGWGAIFGDRFIYWGTRIDAFAIGLAKTKRLFDALVGLVCVLFLLLGVALLAIDLPDVPPGMVLSREFWHGPRLSLFAFWFGVICICFWYFRRERAKESRGMVKQRPFGADIKPLVLPEGDLIWETVKRLPKKAKIDAAATCNRQATIAIEQGFHLSRKMKHAEFRPVHVFGALLGTPTVAVLFGRLGLRFDQFKEKYLRLLGSVAEGEAALSLSPAMRQVLLDAYVEAYSHKKTTIGPVELCVAALRADAGLQEIFADLGVNLEKVENVAEWIRIQENLSDRYKRFSAAARLKPTGAMNRAMTSVATPFLDRVSRDLTRLAANNQLELVVNREREFESIWRAIEGGGKSALLVGQPGVGKNALIEGIAQRMVEEDVPRILQDKRLVELDLAHLVSGATPAEAQERLLAALYEVARSGNIVLAVPNLSGMAGSRGGEGVDLAQTFAGELARGYFFAIGTAGAQEYKDFLEGSVLGRSFVKVEINEPDNNAAIQILEAKAGGIEYRNNVFFSYDAIEAAVEMADRYLHEEFLPEKAIGLAKEAANAASKQKGQHAIVTKEDVAAVIGEKTNIPMAQLNQEESQKLLRLEEQMHGRMIGQDYAVTAVASALKRARAELREQTRPIANFLFLGPTGVGKTELAKTLADVYFGSEERMIRLDMSEYQDKASLYKLIGEPAGETAGGILSEAVRKQPFSLVLLDEIEKANPDILTVFLQVMDDGRLTDNTGRVIDFTNVILIATSNAGSQFVQDEVRKGTAIAGIKDKLMMSELKNYFRPEFLNRFDDIIVFSPLTLEEIARIARLMLGRVARSLEEKGIAFEVTEAALAELAAAGYNPVFGARPLRRVIQDRVENAVADALLKGEVGRRDKLIYDAGGVVRIEQAREL